MATKKASREWSVGIDRGTTYSCVGAWSYVFRSFRFEIFFCRKSDTLSYSLLFNHSHSHLHETYSYVNITYTMRHFSYTISHAYPLITSLSLSLSPDSDSRSRLSLSHTHINKQEWTSRHYQ